MKKDLLVLNDLGAKGITALLKRALQFEKEQTRLQVLQGRALGLVFEKSSTRTHLSFEVAMLRLGGQAIYIGSATSQLGRGESYADTARVMSGYLDGIVLRTYSQKVLEEMAQHARVPVINGLTDLYHPCQILADLMTILELKGDYSGLTIAYVGDGNNMTNTWIEAAQILGFKLAISCPKGFMPPKFIVRQATAHANITMGTDPRKAVAGADVVNTDTWFSMGQKVSTKKRAAFKGFQVNKKLLSLAARDALVLHCLPAHRGEEITDEVMDGPQSGVFVEAENRLYVQMALLEKLLATSS